MNKSGAPSVLKEKQGIAAARKRMQSVGPEFQGNKRRRGDINDANADEVIESQPINLFPPDFLFDLDRDIDTSAVDEEEPTQLDDGILDVSFAVENDLEDDDDEDELEDLDREVPDVWDHPTALHLDYDADDFKDEVQRMLEASSEQKIISALFAMSCTVVFDSVTTTMGVMSGRDVSIAAATTFDNHMATFPLKLYSRNHLLRNFPQMTWPASYVSYIEKIKSKMPTAKALKTAAFNGVLPAQRAAVMFGMTIKARNLKTKAFVNMNLVPNFVADEDLTSGHTREQLLRAMQRSLWPLEAAVRGKNAERAAVSRRKKSGAPLNDAQIKIAYEEARDKAYRKMTDKYYPPEFLVFILFSLPAEDPAQILASLNGGNPRSLIDPTSTPSVATSIQAAQVAGQSPSKAIRAMKQGGREVRRRAEVLAGINGGSGGGGSGGGGSGGGGTAVADRRPELTVVHTHVVEAPVLNRQTLLG